MVLRTKYAKSIRAGVIAAKRDIRLVDLGMRHGVHIYLIANDALALMAYERVIVTEVTRRQITAAQRIAEAVKKIIDRIPAEVIALAREWQESTDR